MEDIGRKDQPLIKFNRGQIKFLPEKGDDVFIRDANLSQGHLGNLTKKSVVELEEIIQRQDATLSNKALMKKLKDGGESLRKRRQEIWKALETVREENKKQIPQRVMVSSTNISNMATRLEWRGHDGKMNEVLDSDDDEDEEEDEDDREDTLDPLKLMAYHSSDVKKPLSEKQERKDVSEQIAQDIDKLALRDTADTSKQDFGSLRMVRIEEKERRNKTKKDSFKPFRPVSNSHPMSGVPHLTQPPCERPTVYLPIAEAIKREQNYVLKERQKINDKGFRRKSELGSTMKYMYHDKSLERHIMDEDDDYNNDDDDDEDDDEDDDDK